MLTSRVRLLGAAALLSLTATQAYAQKQILSVVDAEDGNDDEFQVIGSQAGKTVNFANSGSEGRVLTNFGVNKVFGTATGENEISGTSAWLDTFTAAGPTGSKVKFTLSFTVDGAADYFGTREDGAPEFDFKVFAMRGSGWTMHGLDDNFEGDQYAARRIGAGYDELFLQRVTVNAVDQVEMDKSQLALRTYTNVNGAAGTFRSETAYLAGDDVYRFVNRNPQGGFYQGGYYYDQFYRGGTPDVPTGQPIFYNNGSPLGATLGNVRNTFENNFAVLDSATLCADFDDGCEGSRVVKPTTLTLDFELLAGQSFTIAAWMYVDDVYQGTANFFNTAKFTGLYATDETGQAVAVTSASGTLVALPGGGFAPAAAVPEPESWAMMILGLGAIGGAMRRRRIDPKVTYA